MTRPIRFLLLPMLLVACNDPVVPTTPSDVPALVEQAVVVVTTDTAVAIRETLGAHTFVTVQFPVNVTNTGSDTLQITHCSTNLQAERDGQWITSGFVGCFLTVPTIAEIPPGATYSFIGRVSASSSGPQPDFTGELPGRYRYQIGLRKAGHHNAIRQTPPSNSFVAVLGD